MAPFIQKKERADLLMKIRDKNTGLILEPATDWVAESMLANKERYVKARASKADKEAAKDNEEAEGVSDGAEAEVTE